ncbi:MAG: response regulator [Chloroflexota bacterium]|nr:response regulator [Chloroflexota bacterium]
MEKTALIIDDNKSNRDVLHMMLKLNGVKPVALETPRYLERAFEGNERIDVVFLDLEFPNYSGYDLVKQFKADARLQSTPIIAYSVHSSEVEAIRAAGFDGFLSKPLEAHLFAEQLARILKGESVWSF